MGALEALQRGRAEAESLMLDTCTAYRPDGESTDADGVVTATFATVYEGRCKVQSAIAQAGSPVAGGHVFTVESLRLDFPVSSALQVGDECELSASITAPDLVGLRFRLVELPRGTYRTADRWNVELVTA